MAMMPGNEHLDGKVEFATLGTKLFPRSVNYLFQVGVSLALQLVNVASIAVCVDSMDSLIIATAG